MSLKLALSPEEHLQWAGFSSSQDFYTQDTAGVVRIYWRSVWVPVADLNEQYIISISDDQISCVEEMDITSLIVKQDFTVPMARGNRAEE